jgi:hypothetical protein
MIMTDFDYYQLNSLFDYDYSGLYISILPWHIDPAITLAQPSVSVVRREKELLIILIRGRY